MRPVSKSKVTCFPLGICCGSDERLIFQLTPKKINSLQDLFDPTVNELNFLLAKSGTIKSEDLNSIYEFVYGAVSSTGYGDGAHAIAQLVQDGVLPDPKLEVTADLGKGASSVAVMQRM